MAVPPPLPGKPQLRAELRARRRAHRAALAAAGGLAGAEAATVAGLLALVGESATVALYDPYGHEAAFPGLAGLLVRQGRRLALPALDAAGGPRFAAWRPGDPLDAAPHGTRQPPFRATTVAPDLIVAPLVAFDRRGTRLGQGGGHYDRLFARHPAARRVGCGWTVQEVDRLPVDPWDLPLHAVVTEAGHIPCEVRP